MEEWSWNFKCDDLAILLALLQQVLLHLGQLTVIEEVFETEHIEELDHRRSHLAILRQIKCLVFRYIFVHRDLIGLLTASGSFLNFEFLVHNFDVVQSFNRFFSGSLISILKEGVPFVHCRVHRVLN